MEPEKGEGTNQEGNHEDIGPIKDGRTLAIKGIGMGLKRDEAFMESLVARLAGVLHVIRVHGRPEVVLGQGIVPDVTIGAPGHPLGEPDVKNLAVIGIVVTGDGFRRETIPFRHFHVSMAGTAATGIILPGGGFVPLQGRIIKGDVVQAVAVRTGGGIGVSLQEGAAVPEEGIVLAAVTLTAILYHSSLEPASRFSDSVDILMAVPALEIMLYIVDILFEPESNIPVTASAVDRFRFFFPGHVAAWIDDIRMAACAGVLTVSRGWKPGFIDGVGMT
jgi:hypothetical protein